ncbi:hypothetical protein DPMN_099165 [Dreissena polymorpha]|uniref:Uncharacterized protein n=1 Tax=Dreissena polymorpha TaxID=45954 RepID=A0A9D4R6B6_DREPO|nr:hypothetical protein DPMN_099165 [Dreissena polymorpha]
MMQRFCFCCPLGGIETRLGAKCAGYGVLSVKLRHDEKLALLVMDSSQRHRDMTRNYMCWLWCSLSDIVT